MFHITRLTDIQLSFIHVNFLSDVSLLGTLVEFCLSRRYASFLPAFHDVCFQNHSWNKICGVGFTKVGIKPTFYYRLLKRTQRIYVFVRVVIFSSPQNFRLGTRDNIYQSSQYISFFVKVFPI